MRMHEVFGIENRRCQAPDRRHTGGRRGRTCKCGLFVDDPAGSATGGHQVARGELPERPPPVQPFSGDGSVALILISRTDAPAKQE